MQLRRVKWFNQARMDLKSAFLHLPRGENDAKAGCRRAPRLIPTRLKRFERKWPKNPKNLRN
jgi:hypothetical protein